MTFIEEIKQMEKNSNSKVNMAINDIVNYFREYLGTENFKEYLKSIIMTSINKGENKAILPINFWEYREGCSATYIACGEKRFELSSKENEYQGVRIRDIHKRVCDNISNITQEKLKELGLNIVEVKRRDNEFRFGYYKGYIYFSWE